MTSSGDLPVPDDRRARLRAADADRELVHEILSAAMAHGSLSLVEYEERAGKAVRAKTFGDLDELTDDLPVAQLGVAMPAATMSPGPRVTGGSSDAAVRHRLAIMSGSELSGTAVVADALTATAIMGGVEIDLREVEFTAPVLTVECVVIMGGVEIKVPEGVTVEVGGLGIMGGFGGKSQKSPRPGAPVVRVTGFALMGGVEVKVVPREHPDE
ncbi:MULTISPECIES: DUF1707 SHOCT-like domain-containing protein [Gordonia]|uniref:DUF1707 domain-containing protein n=2 Tax=Gordonia alkanivorans TaxID=84096 RepID=F9VY85_9ACTN|nr:MULTISPECIES: DUF1707 domain-containing protein [Gordonia]AZZ83186.1 DUF1707 domain-containing protein [Gordonia alkanivorans]ETA06131.1 hypothetical protein V525_14725 [Gordonia alkanivorans CGMCC 6845]MDH3008615.1 DUF1707 domain-containing protein [Gordonia alkanivorans]MDH3010558.1 DUF1707 domain-containing protein [Gordonia alkanivorans]MDH3014552.1 DUF1707 domain-containing protein [Gordonia alkanivorans]